MDPGFLKKERGQEQITPALSSFWGNRGDSNPRPSESQSVSVVGTSHHRKSVPPLVRCAGV